MNLINKLKILFSKSDWIETPDFNWNNYRIQFDCIEEEQLAEIAGLCRSQLTNENTYNKNSELKISDSVQCQSLDSLLPLVKQIWKTDFTDTHTESRKKGWHFKYYANFDEKTNRVFINNVLTAENGTTGNVIYSLLVIKKIQNKYYCWNLLE